MNAKEQYQERMKRIDDALAVKEPDRVPLIPFVQTYCITHYGHSMAEAMYNAEFAKEGIRKYLAEYEPDANYGYGSFYCGMGPVFDRIGLKMLHWAGQKRGICTDNSIHQFVEKPYLEDDEYSEMLCDLSGWTLRKYLPRNLEIMEPLAGLSFDSMLGYGAFPSLMQFADPKIAETFRALAEAGKAAIDVFQQTAAFNQEMIDAGWPLLFRASTNAAFDMLSDCLRGTIDTMADLYEQPENVLQAIENFYPRTFCKALAQAKKSPGKLIFIPLHKGLDGFMGNEQYKKFYWPTLKRLVDDLISAGQIPYLYTEGKYDSRLEILQELPAGKCLVHFENVDLKEAKRLVGDHCCICGGFNDKLLISGTPAQVSDEVKRVLDICAPGGGYMFDVNMTIDSDTKPENMEAMFDTVKTYGKY